MMQGRNRGQLHDVAANDSGLGRNPLQNEMRFFPDQAAGRGSAGCGHQGRVKRIDIEAQIDILWKVFRQRLFRQAHPGEKKGIIVGYIVNFAGFDFLFGNLTNSKLREGQPKVEHGAPHDAGVGK